MDAQGEKLKRIRLIVTDIDGVHTNDTFVMCAPTDGKEYRVVEGVVLKLRPIDDDGNPSDEVKYFAGRTDRIEGYTFYSPDGIAVKECIRHDIPVIMMSGRRSKAAEQRAEGLGALYLGGVKDKVRNIENHMKNGISWDEVLVIGNDIQDLSALRAAGFSAAPADAFPEVIAEVDYVSRARAGRGVVREVLQMMLEAKGLWRGIVERERTLG